MQKSFNVRISSKRDSRINWTTNNPILLGGEMVNVIINGRTFLKVGDGESAFNDLPYLNDLLLSFSKTQIEVPAESFTADSTYSLQGYNYRATVSIDGVSSIMIPELILSNNDVAAGNIYHIADIYDGGIHIYAKQQPSVLITIPMINFWTESTASSVETLRKELANKAEKSFSTAIILPASGWTGEGPYTQTVEVIGLTGDRFENPEIIPELDSDYVTAQLQQNAWDKVNPVFGHLNSLEFFAWHSCPTVDIPLIVKVRY